MSQVVRRVGIVLTPAERQALVDVAVYRMTLIVKGGQARWDDLDDDALRRLHTEVTGAYDQMTAHLFDTDESA
jgi:hypothetical protein